MYLQSIFRVFLLKFCILVYYLEIRTTFRDLNFGKNYALFGINLFCLKSGCVKFWTFRRSGQDDNKIEEYETHRQREKNMRIMRQGARVTRAKRKSKIQLDRKKINKEDV